MKKKRRKFTEELTAQGESCGRIKAATLMALAVVLDFKENRMLF